MLASGTMLQGRYRIIRQIGGGGQALVYLAEDTNRGGLRAIKELIHDPNASPQERQAAYDQFEREAQILFMLNHPNLVQVWGHFRVGDKAYLVMDYIDGQTLQGIVDQTAGFLPEAAVLRWAGQLCDVLDYLHGQRPPVIFRDLKPSNVMLDRSDTVKLIDFGIVRLFKPGKKTDTLRMGTMGYAPPEQYEGKGQTDARSDIYSLGATLHQLLTKRDPTQHTPFSFDTAPPHSLNPTVSPHVEAAITKALAYDCVHRFQSASEMKQALMGAVRAPTPTATIPHPAARRRIEFRWPLLGLVAFLVVLVWFVMGQGEPGGSVMVHVPAGEFLMGSKEGDPDAYDNEHPQHTVYVSEFWIDKTEVTNEQYGHCVAAGVCQALSDYVCQASADADNVVLFNVADQPVVGVSWYDAQTYCEWVRKRLPTEAEWEKAARGTDGRKYPWGNSFDDCKVNFCDAANCAFNHRYGGNDGYQCTAPVGSYPEGASPHHALDMAGNVEEWCQDWYDADYYASSPQRDPQGPSSGNRRVTRGGSWYSNQTFVRTTSRDWGFPHVGNQYVGFRCVSESP
jgi:formylglycine-generating enzyme required for sulfatase activity